MSSKVGEPLADKVRASRLAETVREFACECVPTVPEVVRDFEGRSESVNVKVTFVVLVCVGEGTWVGVNVPSSLTEIVGVKVIVALEGRCVPDSDREKLFAGLEMLSVLDKVTSALADAVRKRL